MELLEAQALIQGASTALGTGEVATVDPASTFRVRLQGTFPEARLSLLDGTDAMLPSAGAREVGATTTVTLEPVAPLIPGSHYRLRIDGATSRELKGTDGRAWLPLDLPLLAAGEPPPPRSKVKKAKKRTTSRR